jgi:drug/metabolite transporter (DMT)-like permease
VERTALAQPASPARVGLHRLRAGLRTAQPGDSTLGREVAGAAAATAAMVLLGSSVAAASALAAYPIAGGQALRYGLAGALLFALARARLPHLTVAQAGRLLALAASGLAGFNAFLIAAVREADAATVGVIVGCVPVVLALAGPILERRRVSARVVAAALAVASGAAAVQWADGRLSLAGLGFALGALACEAAFSLLAVPLLLSLGPRGVSAYACLFAVPLLVVFAFALDGAQAFPLPSGREAAALAHLAVLVTALGFVLWYSGLARLDVERGGLLTGLVPMSALVSAWTIGASAITPLRLLGALTVGAGVAAGITARAGARSGSRGACR